jgi:restriction system protein
MANQDNHGNVWMVRSGGGGYLIDEFLSKSIVAIGWNELGEIDPNIAYGQLKKNFIETYPGSEGGSANQSCGQIWRFVKDIKVGDSVFTYDPNYRQYHIGVVESEVYFDTDLIYQHARKVKWVKSPISRDKFGDNAKNLLGSILTIFSIPQWVVDEVNKPVEQKEEANDPTGLFEEQLPHKVSSDAVQRSKEYIIDAIAKVGWQDLEKLVAGILNGMGYKTRLTPRVNDLGSDILASRDGLGLEEPRIKAEVKKRTSDKIGAPELRSFIGGLRTSERGIYVATAGFSKDARYEAERANFSITLVDAEMLVELLIEYYDKMPQEAKAIIPLKKIYWPL